MGVSPNPNEGPHYPKCPIHTEQDMNVLLATDSRCKSVKVYRCPHSDHDEEFE